MQTEKYISIIKLNRIHKYVQNLSVVEKEHHKQILFGLRVFPCEYQERYGFCYEAESTRKGREYAHVFSTIYI